jgi:hypothetical protein
LNFVALLLQNGCYFHKLIKADPDTVIPDAEVVKGTHSAHIECNVSLFFCELDCIIHQIDEDLKNSFLVIIYDFIGRTPLILEFQGDFLLVAFKQVIIFQDLEYLVNPKAFYLQ